MHETLGYVCIGATQFESDCVERTLDLPAEYTALISTWGTGKFLDRFLLLSPHDVAPYGERVSTNEPRLARQVVFATSDFGTEFAWDPERSLMTYLGDPNHADADIVEYTESLDQWPAVIAGPRHSAPGLVQPFYVPRHALRWFCAIQALCAPVDLRTAHDDIRGILARHGYLPLLQDSHRDYVKSIYANVQEQVLAVAQTLSSERTGRSAFDSSLRLFADNEQSFKFIAQVLEESGWVLGPCKPRPRF